MSRKGIGGWLVVIIGGAISAVGSELVGNWWADRKEQGHEKLEEMKAKKKEGE